MSAWGTTRSWPPCSSCSAASASSTSDEVLRKGYGLLPAVPLFTAANICVSLLLKALTGVHGDLMATFAFFLLVLHLQGFHVPLPPLRKTMPDGKPCELQASYRVNKSYLACAPIIFQGLLLSNTCFISEVYRCRDYTLHLGEISWSNLLGKWERSKQFGKLIPVSGMAYYLTTPPTWADATSDLINVCIYDVFLLMGCALVSAAWFRIRACAQRYQARLLGPETISFNQWTRHVIRGCIYRGILHWCADPPGGIHGRNWLWHWNYARRDHHIF
ncbi:protein transport protein Sec61 subunit alpha-like [Brachypodium distachyon]|uniref:Uncharacterized protein n=1 Tax=Brachypodium distachyon TaxID=15368 RepID=A0A2K2CP68_BRADI|nr:protein transport protein Sec61 subunit alpha-like [Brachypodium distachyon]PNT63815.1 hypothetical protein BRADI_4g21273v3 [Brachypodium distachyon]|eukprot:XP_024310278.1 protein transport protein Sec61 subunit alpha-like [Brachypodium distachyon]